MKFISARNKHVEASLSEAILTGLAPDGGLFVPEYFPNINYENYNKDMSYPVFSKNVLLDYFKGDQLEKHLEGICLNSFTFPLKVKRLDESISVLELFHGPTLSFKDFGANFLANAVSRIDSSKPISILVATSGDTGSAVASAFHVYDNINVLVMYTLKGKYQFAKKSRLLAGEAM